MSDIKKILEDAAVRSIAFREAIDGRHVEPDADAIAKLDSFLEALPEAGPSDSDTLALL